MIYMRRQKGGKVVAGHLQEKAGYWYCVLTYKTDNRVKSKWISTGLKVKGNKKRAEQKLILARLLFDPLNPDQKMEVQSSIKEVKPEIIDILQGVRCDTTKNNDKYISKNIIEENELYYMTDLCNEWMEYCHPPRVAESTYAGYKSPVKNHIMPYFTEHKCLVKEVDSKYVQRYFNSVYKKGLSNKTISNHRAVLSAMFNYARSISELRENPMTDIKPPPKSQPIENYFSAEELVNLLEIVKDSDFKYPVYMAAIYGLRRSEVCGLKWDAVDFHNQQFTIRHTLHELSGDDNRIRVIGKDQTKNKTIKVFPLLREIEAMLLDMKAYQKKLDIYDTSNYIYIKDNGKPVRPNYVTDHFRDLLKKNDLRHIRFHDLRHSCASVLLSDHNRSVSLKDIQVWLGHNNIQSTMRYVHIADMKTKVHTAKLMSEIMFEEVREVQDQ